MIWNDHSRDIPEGAHAFLSASQYHWLNYDEEKMLAVYKNRQAAIQGTKIHDFARQCIELGQKLPKSKKTLNSFVNDAIGYKMRPEQQLYFSQNCFGTSDAISFKDNLLRIHDLKTGTIPASMHQLEIYAALFCLEYGKDPTNIDMEFRIYQNDEIVVGQPEGELIGDVMNKIIFFDKLIEKAKDEGDLVWTS